MILQEHFLWKQEIAYRLQHKLCFDLYSKPSLSVNSIPVILHIRWLLLMPLFPYLPSLSLLCQLFNHLAPVNITHRACSHATCFSLLTALALLCKPAVYWQFPSMFIYFYGRISAPYLHSQLRKLRGQEQSQLWKQHWKLLLIVKTENELSLEMW